MINNTLKLLSLAFIMNACATNANFSPEHSLTLEYMQTGNAVSDAKVAIQNKDFTLIGFDQRGLVIPGVRSNQLQGVINTCNIKHFEGMGDVIRNKQHQQKMKTARQYINSYNLEILKVSPCPQ